LIVSILYKKKDVLKFISVRRGEMLSPVNREIQKKRAKACRPYGSTNYEIMKVTELRIVFLGDGEVINSPPFEGGVPASWRVLPLENGES